MKAKWITVLSVAASLVAVAAIRVKAGWIVTFNDLTESPTVTVETSNKVLINPVGKETIDVALFGALKAGAAKSETLNFVLTEPDKKDEISDIVTFSTVKGVADVLLTFKSDADEKSLPKPKDVFKTEVEKQKGNDVAIPDAIKDQLTDTLTAKVISEVVETPEPSSLTLATIAALVGLGTWWWRRRRAGRFDPVSARG